MRHQRPTPSVSILYDTVAGIGCPSQGVFPKRDARPVGDALHLNNDMGWPNIKAPNGQPVLSPWVELSRAFSRGHSE